jgi:hypothetical protein
MVTFRRVRYSPYEFGFRSKSALAGKIQEWS